MSAHKRKLKTLGYAIENFARNTVLGAMADITPEEAATYVGLASEYQQTSRAYVEALFAPRQGRQHAQRIEKLFQRFASADEAIKDSEITKRVANAPTDNLEDIANEHEDTVVEKSRELSRQYFPRRPLIRIFSGFEEGNFEHFRRLVKIANDGLKFKIQEESRFPQQITELATVTEYGARLFLDHVIKDGRKNDQTVRKDKGLFRIAKKFDAVLPYYMSVQSAAEYKLGAYLTGDDIIADVPCVLPLLDDLREVGVDPRTVHDFLQHGPYEQRRACTRAVLRDPALLDMYSTLKGTLSQKQLAASLQAIDSGGELFTEIQEIAAEGRTRMNAAHLLVHAEDIARSDDLPALLDVAREYDNGHMFIDEYTHATRTDQQDKAELILAIAQLQPEKPGAIRKVLRHLEDMEPLHGMEPQEAINYLLTPQLVQDAQDVQFEETRRAPYTPPKQRSPSPEPPVPTPDATKLEYNNILVIGDYDEMFERKLQSEFDAKVRVQRGKNPARHGLKHAERGDLVVFGRDLWLRDVLKVGPDYREKGAHIMRGYFHNPQRLATAIREYTAARPRRHLPLSL
ncbi:MAG: hypothetical protein OXR66_09320 [Candidatus Woesearchaeota archaeon]|nr:hypothetical protein [Candidatus Woesearchaeota archaeon]